MDCVTAELNDCSSWFRMGASVAGGGAGLPPSATMWLLLGGEGGRGRIAPRMGMGAGLGGGGVGGRGSVLGSVLGT